jgi:ATP synthase protein I
MRADGSRQDVTAGDSRNDGWSAFGYLICGMAFYGGVGWLIGHWTHTSVLFPVGMLVGLGVGVFAVIYKYGRQ